MYIHTVHVYGSSNQNRVSKGLEKREAGGLSDEGGFAEPGLNVASDHSSAHLSSVHPHSNECDTSSLWRHLGRGECVCG